MSFEIKEITNRIKYIMPTTDPCSSNVVIVEGDEYIWLYDVGRREDTLEYLNSFDKPVNVVLSHFHGDHVENYDKVNWLELYQGKRTFDYTQTGIIIENETFLGDGLEMRLLPFSSPHAKGTIALEVAGDYLFIGDGTYPARKEDYRYYNVGKLKEVINFLSGQQAKYVLLSHHEPFLQTRENIISKLKKIYDRREKGNPHIPVELNSR